MKTAVVPCLLLAAAAGVTAPAAAQPPSGRYQARPSPVTVCGGFGGSCQLFLLDGFVQLASVGPPEAPVATSFVAAELRLRPLEGGGAGFPFPAGDRLQLTELPPQPAADRMVFTSPPDAAEHVELELERAGAESYLLRGVYEDGCCDGFAYELGGALFDLTGSGLAPAMRLLDGRFEVTVEWTDFAGGSGPGVPVRFDDRSGRFWFFSPDNPELLVKLIVTCGGGASDRIWFFAAGLTNVGVRIVVRDTQLNREKLYESPLGVDYAPVLDTDGFPCSL